MSAWNEMRLSTDLAKSEILSRNGGFANASNEDCCKEIINNIHNKLVSHEEEVKAENKPVSEIEVKPIAKIEEKIKDKLSKIKDKIQKKAEKIGKATKKMAEKVLTKINSITKEKQAPVETINNIKKRARSHLKKVIEKKVNKLKTKLIKNACEVSDQEIERLFALEKTKFERVSNEAISNNNARKVNDCLHCNVRCDGCNKFPIIGNRYKCSICQDFDFCEECEEKNQHPHAFIKIRTPKQNPIKIITSVNEDVPSQVSCEKNNNRINRCDYYINKVVDLNKNLVDNIQELQNAVLKCKNLDLAFDANKLFEWCGAKPKQDESKSLSSKCLSENLKIETMNHTNEVRKSVKLLNNGMVSWPKPCYFTCIQSESSIIGNSNLLRVKVHPEKQINVEVCLDLKNITQAGDYVSVWQLQNEKREGFGQKVIFKVKVKFTNDIVINQEFVEIPREIFLEPVKEVRVRTCADLLKVAQPQTGYMGTVNKMKQIYDLKGIQDKNILYAVVMSQGNMEAALNMLKSKNNRCNYYAKYYN